ncbi:hypothetical protein DPMN_057896 [Dreissena polymorpha]|uniref:Uncharacterized protein n=1 Tax=Dreissena polymorpha TaxID=45954 RepID=A0A9D4HCR9_DREPO|nr:hypothetical protein DPMN_057896 [Dreissena polymorpha]
MLGPRIMKLHRNIDHDSQMTPIDFEVTRSKVTSFIDQQFTAPARPEWKSAPPCPSEALSYPSKALSCPSEALSCTSEAPPCHWRMRAGWLAGGLAGGLAE